MKILHIRQKIVVLLVIPLSYFLPVPASFTPSAGNRGADPAVEIEQVAPTVFFRKAGAVLEQAVDITFSSGQTLNDVILKAGYKNQSFSREIKELKSGRQTIRLYFPDIREQVRIRFSVIVAGKKTDELTMEWIPGRHWQVYLVHGSHHDLGYTDLPDRILEEHKGYIEDILDYCELTETWPVESRFHFAFEAGWSVLYFMEHSSKELREKLIHYLQNGRLELTALCADPITDICGFEELNRLVYPSFELKRKYNVPVLTAELNDIPGMNWGLVSVLAGTGVKYFFAGIQDYFSWGEQVPVPWDEEQVMKRNCSGAFYWEGPDRNRVLFWYGGGSISNVALWDAVQGEDALNKYLLQEEANGYRYDMILTKVLGGLRDNSLPDMRHSEIVKALNEKWEYPAIRFTTNAVFFRDFEKAAGAGLRTLRGDFNQTDYNIITLNAPRETGINRINHDLLASAETFSSIASSITGYSYPRDQIAEAYERMILYDEHTWGMQHPSGPAQEAEESQKKNHAYQASALAHDILVKSLNKIADQMEFQDEGIHIVVFNPLNFRRTDVVNVQAYPDVPVGKPFYREQRQTGDHIYYVNRPGEVPGRKQVAIPSSFLEKPFRVIDVSSGKVIDHQLRVIDDPLLPVPHASSRFALSRLSQRSQSSLAYENNQGIDVLFVAEDVPPLGYKVYRLIPAEDENNSPSSATVTNNSIENRFFKIEYNQDKGITGILDKQLNRELVNSFENFTMGQVLIKPVQSPDYSSPELFEVALKDNGPVFTSLYLKRKSVNCPVINQEIIIFHQVKKIDLATRIIKDPVPFYEIYIGFPFSVDDPRFRIESVNSVIEPIIDQLPGTTTDYYSVNHGLSVFNDQSTVSWSSIEAPVVKISELWPDYLSQACHGMRPFNYVHEFAASFDKSNLYSYISVNNFRTGLSPGYANDMLFRHSFTSYPGPYDPVKSGNHGWAASNPLLPVIVNGPRKGDMQCSGSFCEIDNPNIRLLTIKAAEDGDGLIIRLAETAGRTAKAAVKLPCFGIREVYLTNLVEENITPIEYKDDRIEISAEPFQMITLRLRSGMHIPGNSKFFYSY